MALRSSGSRIPAPSRSGPGARGGVARTRRRRPGTPGAPGAPPRRPGSWTGAALVALALLAGVTPGAGGARGRGAARGDLAAAAGAESFDHEARYPAPRLLARYFLTGTNSKGVATASTGAGGPTSLWFRLRGDGAFRQFDTAPYRECHWDLLRWGSGRRGALVYLGTRAACYALHTEVAFRPGIAYMPKTWALGERWADRGVSRTVYSENDVPVCAGTNRWRSRVVGLVRMPSGVRAVHTETDELQALAPIAGAPSSASCPAGRTTTFGWRENFYLGGGLTVSAADGAGGGSGAGLLRSTGGTAAAPGVPAQTQWDSVFTGWAALPPTASGALTTTTASVANGSPGNTVELTYTAPGGGVHGAVLTIAVPDGWTAPATAGGSGCVTASAGSVATRGQAIVVSGLTLPARGTAVVSYGATSGGGCAPGDGATAPATGGAPVWQAALAASPGAPSADLTSSPSIDVSAPDGSGTLTAAPAAVGAAPGPTTLAFTYTAPTGGMSDGTVTLTVPPGWTPPGTADAPGCTAASAGTVSTDGQTIVLSGLTLRADSSAVITYGASSGGGCAPGDGATAPSAAGASDFGGEEASSPAGTLTALGTAATVTVG